MQKILAIFILSLLLKDSCCDNNPCPHIFQFKSDSDEAYGIITIPPSFKIGFNKLKVTLGLRGDITGGENNLKSVKSNDEVIVDVKRGMNIQFRLNFFQSSLPPNIIKIILNDKVICNGIEVTDTDDIDVSFYFKLPPLSTSTPQLPSSNTSSIQSSKVSWLKSLPFAGSCGKAFTATQTIIGGEEVTEREYPWMVAMYHYKPGFEDTKKYVCGASLISNMYVITAAHCTKNQTHVHLEFGRYNLDNEYETHSVFRTSWKIISHPEYKSAAHGDVALVLFHPHVTFTEWIVPICLWGNFDSELHRGTVAGWGQQNNNDGSRSTTPKQLSVSMVNLKICRGSHRVLEDFATNKTFCAGGAGAGPCHGDSGGGFFVTYNYVQHLRGIISQSIGDARVCNVEEYAVYADLTYALDWMRPYLTDPVGVSIATQKCEEYKQLRANISKSSPEGTSVSLYPHMALVEHEDSSMFPCAGALIGEQFILTTLFCILPGFINESTVYLGSLDKENRNKSGTLQEFKVIQIYKHPSFKRSIVYANIALFKLDRPVEYTKRVLPACLHEDLSIPTNDVQEIGWNKDGNKLFISF